MQQRRRGAQPGWQPAPTAAGDAKGVDGKVWDVRLEGAAYVATHASMQKVWKGPGDLLCVVHTDNSMRHPHSQSRAFSTQPVPCVVHTANHIDLEGSASVPGLRLLLDIQKRLRFCVEMGAEVG
eukprot:296685-Chlamydomonas_euryale.AAC.1